MVTLSVVGLQALSAEATPADVSVNWQVTSDWGTGRNVDVTIANTGSTTINGWSFAMPWSGSSATMWNC